MASNRSATASIAPATWRAGSARARKWRAWRKALSAIPRWNWRSEEHTSELQSLMRISYAVFCLKKHNQNHTQITLTNLQYTRTITIKYDIRVTTPCVTYSARNTLQY